MKIRTTKEDLKTATFGEALPPLPDSAYPPGAVALAEPPPLAVAYHDGPPEIQFAGRRWLRGVIQPVTAQEWTAMQSRPDCASFGFAEAEPLIS